MKSLLLPNITIFMLYVRDLEEASRWYCDHLGFSVGEHDYTNYVELHIDGEYMLHLLKSDDGMPSVAPFALDTPDIEYAFTSLSNKGVETLPIVDYGDNKTFRFKDCCGNTLILTQRFNMDEHSYRRFHSEEAAADDDSLGLSDKPLVYKDIKVVAVEVHDLESASKWYCENLGFTMGDFDYNDYVELFLDGQYTLNLSKTNNDARYRKAHFSLDTADIENTFHSFSAKGFDVFPIDNFGDHKSFHFKDCEGNMLLVTQWL